MRFPVDRWVRLWFSISGKRIDQEISEELEFHLEMRAEEYRLQGLSEEEARRKAEVQFGDREGIRRTTVRRERHHHRRQLLAGFLDRVRGDLRLAIRRILKRPRSSLIAVATLGIGIGVSVAAYNVAYSLLFRPPPFDNPGRIVQIWGRGRGPGSDLELIPAAQFWDLRARTQAFDDLAAFWPGPRVFSRGGDSEQILVGHVTPGFFSTVLGVVPLHGRTFVRDGGDPEEDRHTVLLGHRFWLSHLGGDPSILGDPLSLDGSEYTVVGILPTGHPWLDAGDLFLPFFFEPTLPRRGYDVGVIGRLGPGISREEALADLEAGVEDRGPSTAGPAPGLDFALEDIGQWVTAAGSRDHLWILLGAVSVLFLIACVNSTIIVVSRAADRVQESAIRTTAGATRGRLVQETLLESVLLSGMGAALGFAIAVGCTEAIKTLDSGQLPGLETVGVSSWFLVVTLLVGASTGILTGLLPAFQVGFSNPSPALQSHGPGMSQDRATARIRSVMVASEVALSFSLLIGAALLGKGLLDLRTMEPGFDPTDKLACAISIPSEPGGQGADEILHRIVQGASNLPGVRRVAGTDLPLFRAPSSHLQVIPGRGSPNEERAFLASSRRVTPGFFETLGTDLVLGRDFEWDDLDGVEGSPAPAIINQSLARDLWPDQQLLGRPATLIRGTWVQEVKVVGVVRDLREEGISSVPNPKVYLPFPDPWSPMLVLHVDQDPPGMVSELRSFLAQVDPRIPLSEVVMLGEAADQPVARQRMTSALAFLFSGIALLMAMVGVYGLQGFRVVGMTRELGIRIAVGADRRQVLAQALRRGMVPVLLGTLSGCILAVFMSKMLARTFLPIPPLDPITHTLLAGVFLLSGLVVCIRATIDTLRQDPVQSLKT